MNSTQEINFDGLVGPTHNYAGLSHGNLASLSHRGAASNPRRAALEGLAKMKVLADLGLPQALLPPHDRPALPTLRALGFVGSDAQVLQAAAEHAPGLFLAAASASAMWTANAATFTPSSDSADGRAHFTPANLVSKLHRSIEPPQTERTLRAIFSDPRHFVIHPPVPPAQGMGDEGAANHTRLAPAQGKSGIHLFVYGHRVFGGAAATAAPKNFPSRQAFEASEAIARGHGISPHTTLFAQQHPEAIDAGVFHNDVISVGHEDVFLYHERAFAETGRVITELQRAFARAHPGTHLTALAVPSDRISLAEAVLSYFFNSQLVTLRPGAMALIAPSDCAQMPNVRGFVDELIAAKHSPIREVHYLDLNQSMRNGGGPACLRLRVVLTAEERATLPPAIFLTPTTYPVLVSWVEQHYREHLLPGDLADPQLLEENHRALDHLTQLLGLGSIYAFQDV